MGFATGFTYDNMRRRTAVTNALGNVTFYSYCTCGSLDSIVDALGNPTYFYYDTAGRLTNTIYADGFTVQRNLNTYGSVVNITDSSGNSATKYYDGEARLVAVTNIVGGVQTLAYDVNGLVTNSTDANAVSISMTYDNLHRLLTRSYPDGGVEGYGYTPCVSGSTSYTNQIGNVTRYTYDSLYRKTNEVVVGVTTNGFAYNGAGDLLTLTDGKYDTTTWGYDTFGRVTNKIDAANNLIFAYKYDPDNRLTNRWTPAKGTTAYRYDLVGNLTNVDYSGGTSYTSPIDLRYDALNRLTTMVDGVGTTVYSYDAAGQLLSEGGLWPDDTVSYTYTNRLRSSLSVLAPNASPWMQTYGYDTARRLTNVVSPAGAFGYNYADGNEVGWVGSPYIGYSYDLYAYAGTRVKSLTLPNGAVITNTYDNVARLLSTELMNSSGTDLDSESYAYNQGSQRTSETNTAGDYRNYTYDNEGELLTAIGKEAGGVTNRWQEQFGYAYDAAGNLNWRTNNTLVQRFNVNNLNELTTETNGGRLTVAGATTSPATNVTVNTSNSVLYADVTFASTNQPWANGNNTYSAIAKDVYGRKDTNAINVNLQATNIFAYDLNGNMLTNGNEVLVWNDENELVTNFVTGSWKSEFAYDGKLRRRIERDYTWDAGSSGWVQTNEIHFLYDGNIVIQHRDGNNLPTLTLTRGNDLSGSLQGAGGIGGILAMTENALLLIGDPTAHSYFHADGNGNVTMLINNYQIQVGKALYDPFGNFLSLSGLKSAINDYWFTSKPIHMLSGKYDYLYRWYVPQSDRWLNRDPVQEWGGWNLYAFVLNDPIDEQDPDGLKPPKPVKPSPPPPLPPIHIPPLPQPYDGGGLPDWPIFNGPRDFFDHCHFSIPRGGSPPVDIYTGPIIHQGPIGHGGWGITVSF